MKKHTNPTLGLAGRDLVASFARPTSEAVHLR